MDELVRITVLVDNNAGVPGCAHEHGLAFWIEADGVRILFDTAQGPTSVIDNAHQLGIDVSTADAVVLSHGHYDHSGGLAAVLALNPTAPLYCHPGCCLPRYSKQADGTLKPVGLDRQAALALNRHIDAVHWVTAPCRIGEHIGLTGPIARIDTLEDTGGAFFLDEQTTRPDTLDDDMAMWIQTSRGAVIISGCCHSGIVNTLQAARAQTANASVLAIVGGLHLLHASPQRLEHTLHALHQAAPRYLITGHCTGPVASMELHRNFGEIYGELSVGLRIVL